MIVSRLIVLVRLSFKKQIEYTLPHYLAFCKTDNIFKTFTFCHFINIIVKITFFFFAGTSSAEVGMACLSKKKNYTDYVFAVKKK